MAETFTVNRLAEAFHLDRRTVRRRLARAGVEPAERRGQRALYPLREAAAALLEPELLARLPSGGEGEGDAPPVTEAEAKRRERIARARIAELECAKAEGRAGSWEAFERVSAAIAIEVRQAVTRNLPMQLAMELAKTLGADPRRVRAIAEPLCIETLITLSERRMVDGAITGEDPLYAYEDEQQRDSERDPEAPVE